MRHLSEFGRWLRDETETQDQSMRKLVGTVSTLLGVSRHQAERLLFDDMQQRSEYDPRADALLAFLADFGARDAFERQEILLMMIRRIIPADLAAIADAMEHEINDAWAKSHESSSAMNRVCNAVGGSDEASAVQAIDALGGRLRSEQVAELRAVVDDYRKAMKK